MATVPEDAGQGTDRQGQPGESMAEASPNTRADDQRPAAVEQIKAELREELRAELEAEHKAETDSLRAEYAEVKAENAELRQQLGEANAKLDEYGAKLDAILAAVGPGVADKAKSPRETGAPEDQDKADADQRELQPSPDRPQDEDRDRPGQPERPDKPDPTKPDQRNDALGIGDDEATEATDPADKAAIEGNESSEPDKKGRRTPGRTERIRVFSLENTAAVGASMTVYQSVADAFGKAPPEVGIGASVLGWIAAVGATRIAKRINERRKGNR